MFISFEGPDGSGKSTQARLLAEYLQEKGHKIVLTREPGGSSIGPELRKLLLENKSIQLSKNAELLLFCADRTQHVSEVIKPALSRGETVICDRFIDSTVAYQAGGRGFSEDIISWLNNYSTEGIIPDLTFLIDVPIEIGLKRATKRGANKFEAETIAFHERVRNKYLELAKKTPRIKLIDGTADIQTVLNQIKRFF